MIRITSLIVFALGFGMSFVVPGNIEKKADKVIAKFYETTDFTKEYVSVSADVNQQTTSEFGSQNLFQITSGGQLLGYGYLGNAPSKTATFDYLVLFDPNLVIIKSKVLVYREEYGGEIGSKRWLKQFTGKTMGSQKLVNGENIIPISGATISVRSMTKAINDLLQSLKVLRQEAVL